MNADRRYSITIREETTPVDGVPVVRWRVTEVMSRENRISRRTLSLHDAMCWAVQAAWRHAYALQDRRGTHVPVVVETPKTWPERESADAGVDLSRAPRGPVLIGEA